MSKALQEIWSIEDTNSFVIALEEYISQKCQYGEAVNLLSIPERVFYITQQVEMEVNNGGFDQFFYNSSGDFSNEIVPAFLAIGALHTAEICKKALSVLGKELPTDRYSRGEILEELENDERNENLNECDTAFLEYKDDLNTLNSEYAIRNKEFFR